VGTDTEGIIARRVVVLVGFSCREHSENIQGIFRGQSGNTQGTFREYSENIQGELSGRPWTSIPTARST
jgi:hypothetical protein